MSANYPKDGVLIWGAGAMGGSIGAVMARDGYDVTLVDVNEEHIQAIRRNGLRITGPITEFTTRIDARLPGELDRQWRVAFMAVKARPNADACRALLPHLDAQGAVLSLQNGPLWEVVGDIVGRERTYATVGPATGDILEPGVIRLGHAMDAMRLGQIDGRNQPIVDEIVAAASIFSPKSHATNNVQPHLWNKYCFNTITCCNAVGMTPLRVMMSEPKFRPLLIGLIREVIAVGKANGTYPEASGAFDPMHFEAADPANASFNFFAPPPPSDKPDGKPFSGMWRDLNVHKRRTEVPALLGPISDMGDRLGVKTPLLRGLVAMVIDIEDGRRTQNDDNFFELMKHLAPANAAA